MAKPQVLGTGDYEKLGQQFESALETTAIQVVRDIRNSDQFIYAFLTRDNDGEDKEMAIDATGGVNFEYSQSEEWLFSRINIVIVDAGITATGFGGLSALANGLSFLITDESGNEIENFYPIGTINENYEWSMLAGSDVDLTATQGDDMLIIRFSVFRAGGIMRIAPNHKVRMILRDNLTGLSRFEAQVQGVLNNING